ncbi:MAG: hypothetical protein LBP87_11570 [Planctomycetaceae bacterium]|jgi:hypothetical protein|nr:hypothetical protein [Planctomycetaceae bacterium]
MERLVTGLAIAGVAAFVGSGIHPEFSKPVRVDSNVVTYQLEMIQRDAPVVPDDNTATTTHQGFSPAQDAVCEPLR